MALSPRLYESCATSPPNRTSWRLALSLHFDSLVNEESDVKNLLKQYIDIHNSGVVGGDE